MDKKQNKTNFPIVDRLVPSNLEIAYKQWNLYQILLIVYDRVLWELQ